MFDDLAGLVFGLSFLGVVAAVILLPAFWRMRERRQMIDVVREAVGREGALTSELLETMSRGLVRIPSPQQDLRRGLILIAVGLAIGAIGLAIAIVSGGSGDMEGGVAAGSITATFGAIPGFIGIAYVLLGMRSRPSAN